MEGPHDKRAGERMPVGIAVRLSHGTVDEFVEKFAVNISRGGVFIRTREPKPVGTRVSFELRLAGGEAVVRGQGVVRWVQAEGTPGRPPTAPGGNVTVSDGTSTCTGTVAAGQCNLVSTTAGSKNLTATYIGDTNFNTSTSSPAT